MAKPFFIWTLVCLTGSFSAKVYGFGLPYSPSSDSMEVGQAISQCKDLSIVEKKGHGSAAFLNQAAWLGCYRATEILLQQGADVNGVYQESFHMGPPRIDSPLSYAAGRGDIAMAELLVRHGADLNWRGSLPLYNATRQGHLAMVRWLVQKGAKVPLTVASMFGGAVGGPYEWLDVIATQNKHPEIAEYLQGLLKPARARHEQLLDAVKRCDQTAADLLVAQGAELNGSIPSQPFRPLYFAMSSGCRPLSLWMIKQGAALDWRWDYTGRWKEMNSPLQLAVINEWSELIPLILASSEGLNSINATDWRNWTGLMYAARRGDISTVRLLYKACANIDSYDKKGRTAAVIAQEYGHSQIATLLSQPDANCQMKAEARIPEPLRAGMRAQQEQERSQAQMLRDQHDRLHQSTATNTDRVHIHSFWDVPDDLKAPLELNPMTRTGNKKVSVTLPYSFQAAGFNVVVKSIQVFADEAWVQQHNNSPIFVWADVEEINGKEQRIDLEHFAELITEPARPGVSRPACQDASRPEKERQIINDPWIPANTQQQLRLWYGLGDRQNHVKPIGIWFVDGGYIDLTHSGPGVTLGGPWPGFN